MKQHEKYLEVLKMFDDFITIKEWAIKFDEIYPSNTKKIRGIQKSITSLVSTGKWSNMLLEDKGVKPKRIKYSLCEKEDIENNIHQTKSVKAVSVINFQDLMRALEYLPDDYDLPHRYEYEYFENKGKCVGYKEYIAFEMAIRNKDVLEITNKLDYIDEILEKYQASSDYKDWLRRIEYWENIFDGESPEFSINSEQKKEYIFIAELPLNEFKQEIDFMDIEKELTIEKSKDIISLKIIADYLQNRLVNKYSIYKEGYYFIKDGEEFDPDNVIDSDSIFKHDFNTNKLDDDMKLVIDKLLNRKINNIKQTADMFFMYDYYRKKEEEKLLNNLTLDIKLELTKYHGIKIEGFKEKISYDECVERYEEFKDLKASFYDVEKTISKKLKYMINFIDEERYKFILFY